jgi:hypothetical protein
VNLPSGSAVAKLPGLRGVCGSPISDIPPVSSSGDPVWLGGALIGGEQSMADAMALVCWAPYQACLTRKAMLVRGVDSPTPYGIILSRIMEMGRWSGQTQVLALFMPTIADTVACVHKLWANKTTTAHTWRGYTIIYSCIYCWRSYSITRLNHAPARLKHGRCLMRRMRDEEMLMIFEY